MKKRLPIFLVLVFFMGIVNGLRAQNYLDIPPNDTEKDYLNRIIYGDTTDTGQRVADRVYRLEVGGIYYFNNTIITDGWDLKIVAKDTIADFDKAIILTGKNDQGQTPNRFAEVTGDVLFKNLYFSCISDDETQLSQLVHVYKDEAIIEMENCFVEWVRLHVFRVYSSNTSVLFKDSYFRNVSGTGGPFNGKVLHFEDTPVNEIKFQNNTFVNMQGPMFRIRLNTVNYFKFDHNTVVNTLKWPFHFEYWTDGEVTNNIFFNASAYGENEIDASNQDQEGLMFGMINIFDVPDSVLAQTGMSSQGERKMQVRNNLHFYDQDVKDYIAKWWAVDSASGGKVVEEPWMNSRTQAWFDNNSGFPYLNNENVIVEDIGLVEYPTADSLIKKMDQYRTNGKNTTWFWVDDDEDKIGNATDRPHDLTYSTSSIAYTAADGGFPLGDLNWYPEKKTEWETWVTDVKEGGNEAVKPVGFELAQNYPNPFNPETNISYSLKKNSHINLSVFNLLGQKVKTLVDQKMPAGLHHVRWNGLADNGNQLSSGIYYYHLETDSYKATKKMLLMK